LQMETFFTAHLWILTLSFSFHGHFICLHDVWSSEVKSISMLAPSNFFIFIKINSWLSETNCFYNYNKIIPTPQFIENQCFVIDDLQYNYAKFRYFVKKTLTTIDKIIIICYNTKFVPQNLSAGWCRRRENNLSCLPGRCSSKWPKFYHQQVEPGIYNSFYCPYAQLIYPLHPFAGKT